MEINIIDRIKKVLASDKKIKILIFVGIFSILLIFMSDFVPDSDKTESKDNNIDSSYYSEYVDDLETRTSEIVSSIYGAGNCKVMITLKNTNEGIYAQNTDESINDSSNSTNNEYVLYNGSDGEEPLLIKEYFPQIQGVVIVCEGADDITVKENIVNSIASLYGISTSKICVSKLKS